MLKFSELYKAPAEPVPEELAREEGIEMALDAMRKACASEQVRELVEMREKAMHDWATRMEAAKKEGLEEGRQQLRDTARRMRKAGMPAETIAQLTGLAPDELGE